MVVFRAYPNKIDLPFLNINRRDRDLDPVTDFNLLRGTASGQAHQACIKVKVIVSEFRDVHQSIDGKLSQRNKYTKRENVQIKDTREKEFAEAYVLRGPAR